MKKYHVLVQFKDTARIEEIEVEAEDAKSAMVSAEHGVAEATKTSRFDWFAFDFKSRDSTDGDKALEPAGDLPPLSGEERWER